MALLTRTEWNDTLALIKAEAFRGFEEHMASLPPKKRGRRPKPSARSVKRSGPGRPASSQSYRDSATPVTVWIPADLLSRLDAWQRSAGRASRRAAIIELLTVGLDRHE